MVFIIPKFQAWYLLSKIELVTILNTYFQISINIPTKINTLPIKTFAVIGSFNSKNESSNVTIILALSILATYDTGPSFIAL